MTDEARPVRVLVSQDDEVGFWRWTITTNGFVAAWNLNGLEDEPGPNHVPDLHQGIVSISSIKNLPDPHQPAPNGSSKKGSKPKMIPEVMTFITVPGDTINLRMTAFIMVAEGDFETLPALENMYSTMTPGTASAFKGISCFFTLCCSIIS
jgi:hypothetical protein